MVNGQWSMVNGQWSMVNGQWSMVNGQWSIYKTPAKLRNIQVHRLVRLLNKKSPEIFRGMRSVMIFI